LTNSQRSLTSNFASQNETISMKKLITINETFNTFNTQTIKTFKASSYAALQRELDQLNEKRRRVEFSREMQKIKAVKMIEFSEIILAMSTNRNEIDDFQKKFFLKLRILKNTKTLFNMI
jgi:hypothetical protein